MLFFWYHHENNNRNYQQYQKNCVNDSCYAHIVLPDADKNFHICIFKDILNHSRYFH